MANNQPIQPPSPAPAGLDPENALAKGMRTSAGKIVMFVFVIALSVLAFSLLAINADTTRQQAQNGFVERYMAGAADSSRLEEELFARASQPREELAAPAVQEEKPQIILVRPPVTVQAREKPKPRPVMTEADRELARRYRDMRSNAILSKSAIDGFTDEGSLQPVADTSTRRAYENTEIPAYASGTLPPDALQALMPPVMRDSNGQDDKLQFLTQDGAARTPHGYSEHTRMPQIAQLELKAGAVIPGLLLTGINSDLPGTIIGQVSENVYDSATGKYLLIPQGSRILGVYDSQITYGQKRVGIVWNRLVYPDSSSLNIAGSPGTDLAGYSGVKGSVDNHYGQLFTAALFTSLFAGNS